MTYFFYFLIAILILVVWSLLNERMILKRTKEQLKVEWSLPPEKDYNSDKLQSIKEFYQTIRDDRLDVDDITWNDLDLDELYQQMNNTQCSIGEEYLYALLRKPCFSEEELAERKRLMDYFHENEEKRVELQLSLNRIGRVNTISVYEYMNRLGEEKPSSNITHYLMALGLILSILLIFLYPGPGALSTIFFICLNIYRYFIGKAKIEKFLIVFSYILRLLAYTVPVTKQDIPEIAEYQAVLKRELQVFRKFRRGAGFLLPNSGNGDLMDAGLDYIRMLFHVDLIKYNSMLSFFKKNRDSLNSIYKTIGFLDSCMAASSFRGRLPYYSTPELIAGKTPQLQVTELYHPLISDPVPNSISEKQSVLITGSNASGKSTFIKTLAINALLSQTIYTSVSKSYRGSFFTIFSSMALRDSLFQNESYYIVEIKSLKRILDCVNPKYPMLVLIDEVLRGTNTLERIAASSRILLSLAKLNVLCFAATHDIELTHILEKHYTNYHFQERISNHQILFDYKLYHGRAQSSNAIKLLSLLGYSPDIIKNAETAAEEFLRDGEWKKLP